MSAKDKIRKVIGLRATQIRKVIGFRATQEEIDKLEYLSEATGLGASEVLRQLVNDAEVLPPRRMFKSRVYQDDNEHTATIHHKRVTPVTEETR